MNYTPIVCIVGGIFAAAVYFFAWVLCRISAMADERMELMLAKERNKLQ